MAFSNIDKFLNKLDVETDLISSYRAAFPTDVRPDVALKAAFIDNMSDKVFFIRKLEIEEFSPVMIQEILKIPII